MSKETTFKTDETSEFTQQAASKYQGGGGENFHILYIDPAPINKGDKPELWFYTQTPTSQSIYLLFDTKGEIPADEIEHLQENGIIQKLPKSIEISVGKSLFLNNKGEIFVGTALDDPSKTPTNYKIVNGEIETIENNS